MRTVHLLLALLVVAVWGFNFVVLKVALTNLTPLSLCTIRFFLAAFPAVLFIKPPKAPIKLLLAYGVTMFALQFTLCLGSIYVGLPSGLASLLLQTQTFFTIFLAILFLGETAHAWQVIGAVVAFFGIVIIGKHTDGSIPLVGFLLVIAAAFSWSMGNIFSKMIGKTNMLSLVIWGNLIAFPLLLVLSLAIEGPQHYIYAYHHIDATMVGCLFYLAYPTTIFAFASWSWLLHHYKVAAITPFTLLVPMFGLLSTSLVLGEPLQDWKITGALFVIGGLCINIFGPKIVNKLRLRKEYI